MRTNLPVEAFADRNLAAFGFDLLHGILDEQSDTLDVHIFDGIQETREALLYDSDSDGDFGALSTGPFVPTVSHELRTPLTSINGALGLVCGGSLGAVSEQAIESTRDYAQPLQVNLALTERADGVRVRVDANRLQQVLGNFLSNAAKFSPQGGPVDVAVRQAQEVARVEISDHGPAIPAEFRGRIFQKFSQADSSDTRQKGGAGPEPPSR